MNLAEALLSSEDESKTLCCRECTEMFLDCFCDAPDYEYFLEADTFFQPYEDEGCDLVEDFMNGRSVKHIVCERLAVDLSAILIFPTQERVSSSEVHDLGKLLRLGGRFMTQPSLFYVGDNSYYILDGHHRLAAYISEGIFKVKLDVEAWSL